MEDKQPLKGEVIELTKEINELLRGHSLLVVALVTLGIQDVIAEDNPEVWTKAISLSESAKTRMREALSARSHHDS